MKIWSLAADRPANIFSLLAEIRISISPSGSPLLANEQERFAIVQAYLRENLWKKNRTRREVKSIYFLDLDDSQADLSKNASRRIAKVHYVTRKLERDSVRFPRNHACHNICDSLISQWFARWLHEDYREINHRPRTTTLLSPIRSD